jgi:hypothetical protein
VVLERRGSLEAKADANIAKAAGGDELPAASGGISHVERDADPNSDLAAQLGSILLDTHAVRRADSFQRLLEKATAHKMPVLLAVFDRLAGKGVNSPDEWQRFWRKWAQEDFAAALAAATSPAEAPRKRALFHLFAGLAEAHPDQALAWLEANPSDPHFEEARMGALSSIASTDTKAATDYVLAKFALNPSQYGAAAEMIADSVQRLGFSGGLKSWFDGLPMTENGIALRKAAMDHVYWRLQQSSMEEAAAWVAQQSTTDWRSNRIIAEIATKLAAKDPALAMDWVLGNVPSPDNNIYIGVGEVAKQWSSSPAEFEAWMNGNRGTRYFDQAAHDYAIINARNNQDLAKLWAGQIGDAHLRHEALEAIK